MENHAAAEGSGNLRHLFADMSHAHDAPGFACQLRKWLIKIGKTVLRCIGTGFYIFIIMRKLLQKGKHQGKCMLRHHIRAVVRHIGNLDSAAVAISQVTVVKAGGKFADKLYIGGLP